MLVCLRLRHMGDIVYVDVGEKKFNRDDKILLNTEKGMRMGTVILTSNNIKCKNIKATEGITFHKKANNKDLETLMANRELEEESLKKCKMAAEKRGLEMNFISCEYSFDKRYVTFYYTSEDRVDFRELLKDLAGMFHTRIELHQTGARDKAKIVGGLGCCGRELCCSSYLKEFQPTTLKMAKEQGLSLNPTKVSGICGRLMCCLKNESHIYKECNSELPLVGQSVKTKDKKRGQVLKLNILKKKVKVLIEIDNERTEITEYSSKDLIFDKRIDNNREYDESKNRENKEK